MLNSEVWHSVTKIQIEEIDVIDRILLRQILNAHSKTAIDLYRNWKMIFLVQTLWLMYQWHIY